MGELLSDRSSFKTHISLRMAPITDLQKLSFDLEGRVLEIDPRLIAKTSDKLGIQMAPFWFRSTNCLSGRSVRGF